MKSIRNYEKKLGMSLITTKPSRPTKIDWIERDWFEIRRALVGGVLEKIQTDNISKKKFKDLIRPINWPTVDLYFFMVRISLKFKCLPNRLKAIGSRNRPNQQIGFTMFINFFKNVIHLIVIVTAYSNLLLQ